MPLKYYRQDFLRESMQSLGKQTCPHWRLLIVVEPAEYATFIELLRDELHDPRIDFVSMSGKPFTGSINTGMRRATTPFVALLFADDFLASDAVQVLSNYIQANPRVDFFYSSWQAI